MKLMNFGWNGFFEASWNEKDRGERLPARVIEQQRKFWRVAGAFGEVWAEASGALRLAAEEGGLWPAVGDWVAAEVDAATRHALLHEVLPRKSHFGRKAAGKRVEEQVVAANVDTALLVAALDDDFNPRRIERYIAQCWESGARPVVLLNKADRCADAEAKKAEVERIALGTSVILCSAISGLGIAELAEFLGEGQTIVLLGSSGVGKSTLVNRLLGEQAQETRAVREGDSRGRHTTTARSLFFLRGGAMIIDTPGLRELQLWDAADGIARAFEDIGTLAALCRFRNCTHSGEPRCAVQAAIANGELEAARLANQKKLEREEQFLHRKIDPEAREEARRRVKTINRAMRKQYQQRDADGGKR